MEPRKKPTAAEFPIRFRIPQETDIGFITTHWLREYKHFQPRAVPAKLYYASQQQVIAALSNRAPCLVACPPDDLHYIYGFACGKPLTETSCVLHYVFVRPEWRELGVAERLVAALGFQNGMEAVASHWSWRLEPRRVPAWLAYDPHMLLHMGLFQGAQQ